MRLLSGHLGAIEGAPDDDEPKYGPNCVSRIIVRHCKEKSSRRASWVERLRGSTLPVTEAGKVCFPRLFIIRSDPNKTCLSVFVGPSAPNLPTYLPALESDPRRRSPRLYLMEIEGSARPDSSWSARTGRCRCFRLAPALTARGTRVLVPSCAG